MSAIANSFADGVRVGEIKCAAIQCHHSTQRCQCLPECLAYLTIAAGQQDA